MGKRTYIIVRLLLWLVIIVYLCFAVMYHTESSTANKCKGCRIEIKDTVQHFIEKSTINDWVDSLRLDYVGTPVNDVNFFAIENFIKEKPYVQNVKVYPDINGECVIEVLQREIVYRVISDKGHDFYVDTTGYILNPAGNWFKNVPVITTDWNLPFGTNFYGDISLYFSDFNYYFLGKLRNFVIGVYSDDFLKNLVTQVCLSGSMIPGYENIKMTPRIGGQTIVLGNFDDIDGKLQRVRLFYEKTFNQGWWKDNKMVCFQYGDKIVLKKN